MKVAEEIKPELKAKTLEIIPEVETKPVVEAKPEVET